MPGVDKLESGVNLAASLLSLLGTAFILSCYLLLPHKQHIRHALIVNLTLADFINATNNSASGLWVLIADKNLRDGSGCVVNGFIGQLSVQAVDCSVLLITVVTLWIVTSKKVVPATINLRVLILICATSWVLPIITKFYLNPTTSVLISSTLIIWCILGCIALGKSLYHPASVNWCWIQEHPVYLRYVLTHGWRFLIIAIVASICVYIQIYLRRHLSTTSCLNRNSVYPSNVPRLEELAMSKDEVEDDSNDDDDGVEDLKDEDGKFDPSSLPPSGILPKLRKIRKQPPPLIKSEKSSMSSLEKTMLLNGYPILYVLLWIPGIINRITQAMGHDFYALELMQASTQLIGFANAVTFGWNERIGRHLVARLKAKWKGLAPTTRWEMD